MPRPMKITLVAILLAAATACGSSPMRPTPTSMGATIVSGGFTPNPISLSVGSTVTWTNKDTIAHAITADGGTFSSGAIAPNGQYSYTFPSAGTFTYRDPSSPNMVGTVNVSGSSSPSPY